MGISGGNCKRSERSRDAARDQRDEFQICPVSWLHLPANPNVRIRVVRNPAVDSQFMRAAAVKTRSARSKRLPIPKIMKSIVLSLLLVPALVFAADDANPKKPGKGDRATAKPENMFKKLDTNADGSVSLEEFKAGPRGTKNPTRAEQGYKKMDKDSDGKLTLEEFKAHALAKGNKPRKSKPGGSKATKPKTEV
jgi:hypothetical protein